MTIIHHPSCPARTPYVPAVACTCPASRPPLHRLDPDRPLRALGLVYLVLAALAAILAGVLAGLHLVWP